MGYVSRALKILLGAALPLAYAAGAHAQQPAQIQAQQAAQAAEPKKSDDPNKVKISGVGLNTTHYEKGWDTASASLTFFKFPKSELWLVGGQNYSAEKDQAAGRNDFDIGLKYLRGGNLLRGTLAASRDNSGDEKISAGADWDLRIGLYKGTGISLLGDVSSVGAGVRHTDFGAGAKLNFAGRHNAFFLYSDRESTDENSAGRHNNYRIGYMFLDDKKLASLVIDRPENEKAAFAGFLGLPQHRFILSYDPNAHSVSSVSILTFGNKPLPYYARTVFLANQIILSQHSVRDSDLTYVFQSPFFLEPRGKAGDVAKLHFSYDTKERDMKGIHFYNAFMVKTGDKRGIVLAQNIDRASGNMYYGGGIGYKFGDITPVARFQAGSERRLTLDVNISYD